MGSIWDSSSGVEVLWSGGGGVQVVKVSSYLRRERTFGNGIRVSSVFRATFDILLTSLNATWIANNRKNSWQWVSLHVAYEGDFPSSILKIQRASFILLVFELLPVFDGLHSWAGMGKQKSLAFAGSSLLWPQGCRRCRCFWRFGGCALKIFWASWLRPGSTIPPQRR